VSKRRQIDALTLGKRGLVLRIREGVARLGEAGFQNGVNEAL